MSTDFDLIVVGGGLAGGSLALALRDSGLGIAVVESVDEARRQASPAGERALALAWGTTQLLDQLGVWRQALPHAAPIRTIHVSDRGHFGKVRLSAEREGVPALGYVATARVLEDAIAEALTQAPVTLLQPATVAALHGGNDHVGITVRQGDQTRTLTARLVVAADGGNSTVRHLLDIGQTERDYGQTAIVSEVASERPNHDTAYERFTESGPLALLPLGKRRSSVVWTLSHDDARATLALSDEEFRDRLQATFGQWLGRLELASARQGFPLKLIRSQRMINRRVVLVGNAMHQLHPVAGQGFNLGLRDVAVLAERIEARRQFGEDIGAAEFLESYARTRRDDLDRVIGFTDTMVRLFSNNHWPLTQARNIGMTLLNNLPPIKRRLARYAMGLGERLPVSVDPDRHARRRPTPSRPGQSTAALRPIQPGPGSLRPDRRQNRHPGHLVPGRQRRRPSRPPLPARPQGPDRRSPCHARSGEDLFAILHSHPTSPAEPSQIDLAEIGYPETCYLIISLNTKGVLEMRGFRLGPNRQFDEVELALIEALP